MSALSTDIHKHFMTMNNDIKQLCDWLRVNKPDLNVNITDYMLFSKSNLPNHVTRHHYRKETKYFHRHIYHTCKQLSRSLFSLNRVKHFFQAWGGTHRTYIKKIMVLQRQAILVINKALYNDQTIHYCLEMRTLKLDELCELQIA